MLLRGCGQDPGVILYSHHYKGLGGLKELPSEEKGILSGRERMWWERAELVSSQAFHVIVSLSYTTCY